MQMLMLFRCLKPSGLSCLPSCLLTFTHLDVINIHKTETNHSLTSHQYFQIEVMALSSAQQPMFKTVAFNTEYIGCH